MRLRHRIFFRVPVSATLAFNPLWPICDFPAATSAPTVFVSNLLYLRCISCLRTNSYCFSEKFARSTASDAPIAKPSTCTYHESFYLKYTLQTTIFKNLFIVALRNSRGNSWLYSFCKAISISRLQDILWFHPVLEQCFQFFLWLTKQYPENWSAKVAADALCKIVEGKGKPMDNERCLLVLSNFLTWWFRTK